MRSRFRIGAALGGAAVTLCLGMGVAAPAGAAVTHSGGAQVVEIDLTLLGVIPITSDISKVELPPGGEGGYFSESLLTVGDPGIPGLTLNASVAQAVAVGSGNDTNAHAHVADANLGVTGLVLGATVLQSNAKASCNTETGNVELSGSSYIAQLRINNTAITILPDNQQQSVVVPGVAEILINEQQTSTGAGSGSITVNALHVKLLGGLDPLLKGDIIISRSTAGVSGCEKAPPPPTGCGKPKQPPCPPPPPPPACPVKDFVTGGGWIVDSEGDRVSFAVHGGVNSDGTFRNGGLNIVDHGDDGHRSSKNLTGYGITGPTTRRLDFDIGTVKVDDQGEPGTNDKWQFTGTDGYSATSADGRISGGNIQLHRPRGCQDAPTGGGNGGGKPH